MSIGSNLQKICWLLLGTSIVYILLLLWLHKGIRFSYQYPNYHNFLSDEMRSNAKQVNSSSSLIWQQITTIITPNNPWQASLLPDNIIRFQHVADDFDALLKPKPELRSRLLNTIVPVIRLLSQPHFSKHIKNIYLESHTSDSWGKIKSRSDRFKLNRTLSVQRARSIYRYLFSIHQLAPQRDWMRKHLLPYGLSFEEPILNEHGNNDSRQSTRLDFIIILKS